ncbi:hypothetical protein TNCV_4733821 [Trichonephila clavipes]|nr:hypothetical protein TNCV_4733821 [Trichonephila clavipes]
MVLIPEHWSFRREYSQNKRGRERLAWELPDFIKRIGFVKVRQLLRKRENRKAIKIQMRKRVRHKLSNVKSASLSDGTKRGIIRGVKRIPAPSGTEDTGVVPSPLSGTAE